MCGMICLAAAVASAAVAAGASTAGPKFCNVILHNQGADSITGLHRFVDAARERGLWDRVAITVLLNGMEPELQPGERDFFKELIAQGHEIGVERIDRRAVVAAWLGIPEGDITFTGGQLFADAALEQQAAYPQQGYLASANVCVEGNSLAEYWDIPHNWEGAPMFPYWAQWAAERWLATDRTNRELDKDTATLELHWATRTLWHNHDRFPIPMCFHFGEPLKREQWRTGQLVHEGEEAGWWRVELAEYERNLDAGRAPFIYINTASEANIFTPGGAWKSFLDSNEALACALDLVGHMLGTGWRLVTVSEFTAWFSERWPCPASPSMVFLMNDTLANRRDRDGLAIAGNGQLLHAETKHFQICDHSNRMAPQMVIAYDLRTPNLLRGGYTFADPARWDAPESRDAHYGSTTGNALFWSPMPPLADARGEYYFPPSRPEAARERTFTLHLGDDWEPWQFAPGEFHDVGRDGDRVFWSKTMSGPAPGTRNVRVTWRHELDGPVHRVTVEITGDEAVGMPVRLRLAPHFYPGWDQPVTQPVSDPNIPEPGHAGQDRNVFAETASGSFAWSDANPERVTRGMDLPAGAALRIANRNPGTTPMYSDNPDFNRGVTVTLGHGARLTCIDDPGPAASVTVVADLGPHQAGRSYAFDFRYWHGEGDAAR